MLLSSNTLCELAAGGLANACASFVLNWSDVVKIRLQTQEAAARPMYRSFWQAARRIIAEEGVFCSASPLRGGLLLPGIVPSLMREIGYSSFRFGMYPEAKRALGGGDGNEDVGLARKVAAGLTTGGLGSALATPTDLVKIRFQAEAGRLGKDGMFATGLRRGRRPTYSSALQAFAVILREDGIAGLYRGVGPTMARAAFLASGQLASYDETKAVVKRHGLLEEGFPLHLLASFVSGLVATTACQPFDTIKSRVMADRGRGSERLYTGMLDCCIKSVKAEGIVGLYTGWFTAFLRLGPHGMIGLPLWEYFRHIFGLGYLQ